eukprot:TRINITY_DN84512_c0_g1_i1.p1 TRINITY_DN84512_c0_g1~~TRINITY_DN84512_c0_g1_i1.p1  ORF type:complete len:181 (+),score=23.84 TRINITY_DN84512_c0_g1_i1:92-634(+)
MELLRIEPRQEWEWADSDCEDMSIGSCVVTNLTLEAGDLSSDSEESLWPRNDWSATTSFNSTSDNSIPKSPLSMNLLDPSAGCWKHWEKLAAEHKQQMSVPSALSGDEQAQAKTPGMGSGDDDVSRVRVCRTVCREEKSWQPVGDALKETKEQLLRGLPCSASAPITARQTEERLAYSAM